MIISFQLMVLFMEREMGLGCITLFLMLQWQQTVHRYLRVLHRRMMKRPPKNVTMDEARKAHHMR